MKGGKFPQFDPDAYHDVYIARFKTSSKDAEFHGGLFVHLYWAGDNVVGHLYHVDGPYPEGDRASFEVRFNREALLPGFSGKFKTKTKIGRIKHRCLEDLVLTCEQMPPPNTPIKHRSPSPNCNDWVNNLIIAANRKNLVEFDREYKLPKTEVAMVLPESATGAGASASK